MVGRKLTALSARAYVSIALAAIFGLAANLAEAAPFTTIYIYSSTKDGKLLDPLTADAEGNLYGTASRSFYSASKYCGGIFRLNKPVPPSTAWTYTDLYTATPSGDCDPLPVSPVLEGRILYGMTYVEPGRISPHSGSVFSFDVRDRIFSILHSFDKIDGVPPNLTLMNGLLAGPNGTFYGTTYFGGPNMGCANPGYDRSEGVLFKLGPAGEYQVLHAFGHGNSNPNGALVFGPNGAMYGTTARRCNGDKFGAGTVFRVTTDGKYSVIHDFTSKEFAYNPKGRIVFGADGTLYGTTSGAFADCRPTCGNMNGRFDHGTVWSLKPGAAGEPWIYNVIHKVVDYSAEGEDICGLTFDESGNLYGTASFGGLRDGGSLYRLSPPTSGSEWNFKVLHSFTVGDRPQCDPIVVGGTLYGTAGGYYTTGTEVFSYDLAGAPK